MSEETKHLITLEDVERAIKIIRYARTVMKRAERELLLYMREVQRYSGRKSIEEAVLEFLLTGRGLTPAPPPEEEEIDIAEIEEAKRRLMEIEAEEKRIVEEKRKKESI